MRIFLSRRICGKRSYVKQTLLPIAAVLIFLLVFPIILGTTIAANGGIQKPLHQWLITVLLLLLAAAAAWMLHRIGVQAHNDAWVFCTDSRESLFAVNIKELVSSKHNMRHAGVLFIIRFLSVLAKTGRMLDEISRNGLPEHVKSHSVQIMRVERLLLASGRKYAVCTVSAAAGSNHTQRYDITDFPQELTAFFEQHCTAAAGEAGSLKYTKQILLGAAMLLLLLSICIASHPSVGFLPGPLYFPCLFLLQIPLIFTGIFLLKRKRGE